MKRLLFVAVAFVAFGLFAGSVSAQIRPRPIDGLFCETSRYDEDADGLLTKTDFNLYFQRLQSGQCMDAEATGACAEFDVNQDGRVTAEDLRARIDYFMTCRRALIGETRPRPR